MAVRGLWHVKNSFSKLKKVSEASGNSKWLSEASGKNKMAARGLTVCEYNVFNCH